MKIKVKKLGAIFLALVMIIEIVAPTCAFAIGGGPTQPEFERFSSMADPDMVDLFSGDMKYNIPLLEVGGYPINLAYNAGSGMDEEASWVGSGWNINVGAINRNVRGMPDDYKGDIVSKDFHIKPNETWGVNVGVNLQIAGAETPSQSGTGAQDSTTNVNLEISLGIFKNNYTGYGLSLACNPSVNTAIGGSGTLTGGLGLEFNSQEGMSANASVGVKRKDENTKSLGANIGVGYNSRQGLKSISYDLSYQKNIVQDNKAKTSSPLSVSGGISLSPANYNPIISVPYHNYSYALSGTIGSEAYVLHPSLKLSGFYSKQEYNQPFLKIPTYGYIYSHLGKSANSLNDFLRENDGAYTKGIPCLPFPVFTYDQFNVSGEGIGGQFRPYRSDVGILHDKMVSTTSASGSAGIEIGLGVNAHGGGNGGYTEVVTSSGKWKDDNNMRDFADFEFSKPYTEFESFYFKRAGELTPYTNNIYGILKDNNPVRIKLRPKVDFAQASFDIFNSTGTQLDPVSLSDNLIKTYREPRNTVFTFLTAQEAEVHGINKKILSYPRNTIMIEGCENDQNQIITKIPRTSKPLHHISEITLLDTQGKRYIYGLPAYTQNQQDISFSVSEEVSEPLDGIVYYNFPDNTVFNNKGNDHYFSRETRPSYANTFLLTEILSPNYVDQSADGISSDDFGDAVKFNYTKTNSHYKYRAPYGQNTAYYNGGLNSGNGADLDIGDAKASYVWGTKELWYLHSIESKTHVALFVIQNREDGMSVKNSDGEIDSTNTLQLLQEIKLFTKSEYILFGENATPVKVVHFVYDYSICPGIPSNSNNIVDNSIGTFPYYPQINNVNSEGGKLTLKKIYFTYGSNQRGKLNPYKFSYKTDVFGDTVFYGMKQVDRWGTFKSNLQISPSHSVYGKINNVLNGDFPYSVQDTLYSNEFARLWNISHIDLPSGAKINIEYESDDYFAVQNKFAHQMYFIEGFNDIPNATTFTNSLYDNNGNSNDYIYIRVPDQTGVTDEELIVKFLNHVDELFCRVSIDLGNNNKYDFLSSYAQIDRSSLPYIGVTSDPNIIWIKLKSIEQTHPIALQAWQFMRTNAQELIYSGSEAQASIEEAIRGLVGSISEIVGIFTEFKNRAMNKKLAKHINTSKSWVRLSNSNGFKIGGGHRVKKIHVTDSWQEMTGSSVNKSVTYITNYDYTATYRNITISSGVASYEPGIGQEENTFKRPVRYKVKRGLGPDDHLYLEEPFGELLFPNASVGYGKVTINKGRSNDITRTATGKIEKEFYTANDFPVIYKRTPLDPNHKRKPRPSLGFIYSRVREYQAVTQGYLIELNDMHGRVKSEKTIDEFGKVVTSKKYNYKQLKNSDGHNILDNNVKVVDARGGVQEQTMGMDSEIWLDMREETTKTDGLTVTGNTEFFVVTAPIPIPILIPPIIPTYVDNEVRFRSAVSVKCISRYGILDNVITSKDGSQITETNVLHDAVTGDAVLTQTTNEFNDSLFNLSIPAHWAYNRMGSAYKNVGVTLHKVTQIVNGVIDWPFGDPNDYLIPGDEIEIYANGVVGKFKLWASEDASGNIVIINRKGEKYSISMPAIPVNLKVIRSARKNLSSFPIEKLISKNVSPYNSIVDSLNLNNLEVINTEAHEFKDEWKIDCDLVKINKCEDFRATNFCFYSFLDSLIVRSDTIDNPLFVNSALEDSISIIDILTPSHSCLGDSANFGSIPLNDVLFYPVSPPLLTNHSYYSEWKLGPNCYMTIQSIDSEPLDLENLHIIQQLEFGCLEIKSSTIDTATMLEINVVNGTACFYCEGCSEIKCGIKPNNVVNPYLSNIKNNWNLLSEYKYYTRRNALAFVGSNLQTEGEFDSHIPFWQFTSEYMTNAGLLNDNWINSKTVTRINHNQIPIEENDALARPSSLLLGYQGDYAKAVISNSKAKNAGNDNFEDSEYFRVCTSPCWKDYFSFTNVIGPPRSTFNDTISHTGNYSVEIIPGGSIFYTASNINDVDSSYYKYNREDEIELNNACLVKFSPDSGKYVISAWIKEPTPCDANYTNGVIILKADSAGTLITKTFSASGPVIEGWQRIEGIFNIPGTFTTLSIELRAIGSTVYFDDFRIFPAKGNMKTFVYDALTHRLMAELDENNYATFFEYDEEATLIRIKKETERGIITLKETRRFVKN